MAEFWNLIVESNTFNFAILVVIFAVLFAKINLPEVLSKLKADISNSIENAKKTKDDAIKSLKDAKKAAKNTDSEVQSLLDDANATAKNIADGIINNAKQQSKHITDNIERVVKSEEKKITAEIRTETVKKSINIASDDIINRLKTDESLQNKLIEESIKELDNINL